MSKNDRIMHASLVSSSGRIVARRRRQTRRQRLEAREAPHRFEFCLADTLASTM
jgi:hypothetical protein